MLKVLRIKDFVEETKSSYTFITTEGNLITFSKKLLKRASMSDEHFYEFVRINSLTNEQYASTFVYKGATFIAETSNANDLNSLTTLRVHDIIEGAAVADYNDALSTLASLNGTIV